MGTLDGKRVIVTGAARGIGRAIAARIAAEGAQVVLLDRDADAIAQTAADLGVASLAVDLVDVASTRTTMRAAIDLLGGLDVLVNNAGVFLSGGLLETDPADWDRVQVINTRSMLVTTQEAVPAMRAGGGGRIINLASMAAKSGGGFEGAYAASKAAVVALTRATAQEFGSDGITANALCPGYVLTEMGADTRTPEMVAAWSSRSPLGRCAAPDDVADVAAFLAGDASRYMTGQSVNVTGGMIMH
ncbi:MULTISPECIES: SDR family NAD(P)-dependent oxidoreductase [Microbacterium]|jgi:NAD(P)-dependent dehydrogenase (short-subunit alcohol dehydrogenase family)|uniref:SDR family NAD(P)-dependent oxidoreductase n=1 Tax=Microbacterium TaxID=33882 RepID=UPI0010F9D421|nr:SDR family NAD(P)-dependent oxidoreductase [Microbacterium sp. 4NA327F11]MCK9916926.1 SDR family oxidoreductase [Microbacteriaceae bacterium K1510]